MTRRANGQRAHSGQTGVWSSAERCPKVEEKNRSSACGNYNLLLKVADAGTGYCDLTPLAQPTLLIGFFATKSAPFENTGSNP